MKIGEKVKILSLKGNKVGKIVEIKKNKNDISRSAIVEPCVSIRTISEVGVIVE